MGLCLHSAGSDLTPQKERRIMDNKKVQSHLKRIATDLLFRHNDGEGRTAEQLIQERTHDGLMLFAASHVTKMDGRTKGEIIETFAGEICLRGYGDFYEIPTPKAPPAKRLEHLATVVLAATLVQLWLDGLSAFGRESYMEELEA